MSAKVQITVEDSGRRVVLPASKPDDMCREEHGVLLGPHPDYKDNHLWVVRLDARYVWRENDSGLRYVDEEYIELEDNHE